MIDEITVATVEVVVEEEELCELVLDGLLIVEDGRLVGHDGTHVGMEGLHILADEDPMLLGLILVGVTPQILGVS